MKITQVIWLVTVLLVLGACGDNGPAEQGAAPSPTVAATEAPREGPTQGTITPAPAMSPTLAPATGTTGGTIIPATITPALVAPKLGAGLAALYLMKKNPTNIGPSAREVIEAFDKQGGPTVTIRFKRELTEAEEEAIEREHSLKFSRYQGRAGVGPFYTAVVPWDQLLPLGETPLVVSVTTRAWPPPVGNPPLK